MFAQNRKFVLSTIIYFLFLEIKINKKPLDRKKVIKKPHLNK